MTKILELVKTISKMKLELQQELAQKSKDVRETFIGEIQQLMCQYEIHTVAWRQYIPGFNDGDPCAFNLGGICYYKDKPSDNDEFCLYDEDHPDNLAELRDPRNNIYWKTRYDDALKMSDDEYFEKYATLKWKAKEKTLSEHVEKQNVIGTFEHEFDRFLNLDVDPNFIRSLEDLLNEDVLEMIFHSQNLYFIVTQDSYESDYYDCGY